MSDIGVYIHVPFCKHLCPYCDFYKIPLRDRPARDRLDFPERIAHEWDLIQQIEPEITGREIATIYFGGGTPSTLSPEGVGALLSSFRDKNPVADDVEITLEANPENLTEGRCEKWRAAGINRLSIGIQSLDNRELTILERLHDASLVPKVVANARNTGIENISLDLMFALPGQTLDGWLDSLRQAIELTPNHLSFYGLTFHEDTPFFDQLSEGSLEETDEDLQAEMYIQGSELLCKSGFEHYEISNFARPAFQSKHNRRYWSRADVIGLGPGAHSNHGDRRWRNPDDLDGWAEAIENEASPRIDVDDLPPDIAEEEKLFTALRRQEGIGREDSPHLYTQCLAWRAGCPSELEHLSWASNDRFGLTVEGWLVSNGIIQSIIDQV